MLGSNLGFSQSFPLIDSFSELYICCPSFWVLAVSSLPELLELACILTMLQSTCYRWLLSWLPFCSILTPHVEGSHLDGGWMEVFYLEFHLYYAVSRYLLMVFKLNVFQLVICGPSISFLVLLSQQSPENQFLMILISVIEFVSLDLAIQVIPVLLVLY